MDGKKVTAVVTRAVPYNETDMILTLVSLEEGRLTATAKGCLKPKAKLRYAAEPMNFGEYMLTGRPDRLIVAECSQIESFTALTADIDKYYAAALVLEVLQKLSPESQPPLFMHAVAALKGMAFDGVSAEEGITSFLFDALSDNGYDLDFSTCNSCKCMLEGDCAFSESEGIVCLNCKGYDAIVVDGLSRSYFDGLCRVRQEQDKPQNGGFVPDIPRELKNKANILLSDIVYSLLGVKINNQYFTERL